MSMGSAAGDGSRKEVEIATFAVIDLETNDLPQFQFNKCGITELSIYAFSAKCLNGKTRTTPALLQENIVELESSIESNDSFDKEIPQIPELPRVLHKLTLMINPRRLICEIAEKTTKLSNEMLCDERHFDEHTANLVINFLNRLIQPVCLVAHNGNAFDFPIIRHVLDNLEMKLPSTILCVDSLKAFRELDSKYDDIISTNHQYKLTALKAESSNDNTNTDSNSNSNTIDILEESTQKDWQKINEITPQRPIKRFNNKEDQAESTTSARKCLFKDKKAITKRAPRGFYKLTSIYERIFQDVYPNAHHAESDVHMLTKLLLHYGEDFQEYANQTATSFDNVKPLGSRI